MPGARDPRRRVKSADHPGPRGVSTSNSTKRINWVLGCQPLLAQEPASFWRVPAAAIMPAQRKIEKSLAPKKAFATFAPLSRTLEWVWKMFLTRCVCWISYAHAARLSSRLFEGVRLRIGSQVFYPLSWVTLRAETPDAL